jgi:hypothetical protein
VPQNKRLLSGYFQGNVGSNENVTERSSTTLCVYNNETTARNNLECRAKEKRYVSRRKIPKLT